MFTLLENLWNLQAIVAKPGALGAWVGEGFEE
jgi:hypothetical protein